METLGFKITDLMIGDMVEYAGLLFTDLSSLILLIIGVSLGLIVIGAIISAVRS